MGKKLTLIGMIVAAFAAFVIPAAASASPVLTSEDNPGVPVPVGTTLLGTSTNAITVNTKLGELKCNKVTINAEVTGNSGTSISAKGLGGSTEGCTAGGKTLIVDEPTLKTLSTSGEDKGTLSMFFKATVGAVTCPFEGSGSFTYTTGKDTLQISNLPLTAPELCLVSGKTPEFSATFTIETTDGTPVIVS